jgi:hypothetical protein
VSGTDEVLALHKDEQEEEEDIRRRGVGGSPDLEDSSSAGLCTLTVLYYCTVQYCTVLYCTVLYCTVPDNT